MLGSFFKNIWKRIELYTESRSPWTPPSDAVVCVVPARTWARSDARDSLPSELLTSAREGKSLIIECSKALRSSQSYFDALMKRAIKELEFEKVFVLNAPEDMIYWVNNAIRFRDTDGRVKVIRNGR